MNLTPVTPSLEERGLRYYQGYLDRSLQQAIRDDILSAAIEAPFFTPVMPRTGRPFTVRMTNLGPRGWVSERSGYRYQKTHPETQKPWPAISERVIDIWRAVASYPHDPEACLVNCYFGGARMGLHRDQDEEDFSAPVVSISLGDTAIFRIGGKLRSASTTTLKLASGDVL